MSLRLDFPRRGSFVTLFSFPFQKFGYSLITFIDIIKRILEMYYSLVSFLEVNPTEDIDITGNI